MQLVGPQQIGSVFRADRRAGRIRQTNKGAQMKKELVIHLIKIGDIYERKLDQIDLVLDTEYWYSGNKDSFEVLLMDILGIPKGLERDDFPGILEVYQGTITPNEVIQKAEVISDPLIKPSTEEIINRLLNISERVQSKIKGLEKMLDAKINLMNEVIYELDVLVKQLDQEGR